MKAMHVIIIAVLAGLVGVAGAVVVMKPSSAMKATPSKPESPVAEAPTDGVRVASLGSVALGADEIKAWLAGLPPQARSAVQQDRALFEDWARRRLAEKALIAEAREQGWEKRDEVVRAIDQAEDQILLRRYLSAVSEVPASYPDEATLKQVYENGKADLRVPERYRLRQIFLAVDGDADQIKARAERLAKEARAKRGDFAALARQHSDDTATATDGGDLGLQALSQLAPEARPVVSELKDGQVSEPFRTAAGWHLIKLEKTEPARTASFEEVREQLSATLREQRRRENAEAYLRRLVGESSLSIDGAAVTALLQSQ